MRPPAAAAAAAAPTLGARARAREEAAAGAPPLGDGGGARPQALPVCRNTTPTTTTAASPYQQQQHRRRRRQPAPPLLLLLATAAAVAALAAGPSLLPTASAAPAAAPADDPAAPGRISPPPSSPSSDPVTTTSSLPDPEDPNRDGGRSSPHSAGLAPAASVTALYCPNGGALEGGLCYPRCRLGWRGAGCTCWRGGLAYARGCGRRPAVCEATSFRKNPLPPVVNGLGGGGDGGDFTSALAAGAGGGGGASSAGGGGGASSTTSSSSGSGDNNGGASVTLVFSTDPQLFRNGSSPDTRATAVANNALLAASINRVRDLGDWPQAAGGGRVAEPRALVVLGDLTEGYREREADAFRHYYDPSFPGNEGERVRFPTWLMLGNHDYVNNAMGAVGAAQLAAAAAEAAEAAAAAAEAAGGGPAASDEDNPATSSSADGTSAAGDFDTPTSADYEPLEPEAKAPSPSPSSSSSSSSSTAAAAAAGRHDSPCSDKAAVAGDGSACAKRVVDEMRALLSPRCPTRHWSGFPKENVTSFDADSMAYSFDYGRYHFVALHFSPRHRSARLAVLGSMAWFSRELSHASAAGRRVVVLVHAHGELGLTDDPTFGRAVGGAGSPVVAVFFGHIHVRPWGYAGTYPRTAVPMYNCGASWYNTYCVAEFAEEGMRVGAVSHGGDGRPRWFGHSAHLLPPPGAPLAAAGGGGGAGEAAAARSTGVAAPSAKPALLAYEPNPKGSPWLLNGVVAAASNGAGSGGRTTVWAAAVAAAAVAAAMAGLIA